MSKIVFRMRLPSPNLVVEFDEESGRVTIHACSTSYTAREQEQLLGGEGRVVELSDLVSKVFKLGSDRKNFTPNSKK
jgi:hypothetical protein